MHHPTATDAPIPHPIPASPIGASADHPLLSLTTLHRGETWILHTLARGAARILDAANDHPYAVAAVLLTAAAALAASTITPRGRHAATRGRRAGR